MNDRAHILVVDDDPNNVLFLNEILRTHYEITLASTGQEALDLAQSTPPDLVLLDVSMPVMNGYEICQKLKEDDLFKDTPVIFLSANDNIANKIKGFEVGGVDYVTKPFSIGEILERVKTHLGLRNAQQALQAQNALLEAEIHRRQAAENQLTQSEERYRLLFEKTNDAVFIIGMDYKYIEVNQRAADLLGYSIAELINQPIINFVVPEEHSQTKEVTQHILTGDLIPTYERQFVRKDGSLFVAEVNVSLIHDDNSQPLYIHSVIRDISDRKQVENEREQLIAELDAFAHTVAHDLKNPLSALKLYSGMLEAKYDLISTEKRKKHIASMSAVTEKMTKIVDSLLLLSSVRKKSDIDIHELDMPEIIAESKNRLKQRIKTANASYTIADDFPISFGYAPWIEEVWANYISNALKYGGKPPHFEIGADIIDENYVRFWVKDDGDGLSKADQDKLFTPFTRLDTVKVDGHGLGLSIVQRITKRLNGYVGIESEVGDGSTFYFVLPRHAPKEID